MKHWGCWSALTIEAAARTHVGRRDNNEDAFLLDDALRVYAVADGMGGYHGGEVASGLVVRSLKDFMAHNAADADVTWPWGIEPGRSFVENLLSVALRVANQAVLKRRRGRLAKMGSTAVAVAMDGRDAVLAHIGDSRIYRLREGVLERLTRDHSLVEQLRAMGARESPEGIGHVITKAVGFDEDATPDLRVERAEPGDVLLLCSDGLSDPLDDDAIRQHLMRRTADEAAQALVHAAYAAGGSDNITALVLRFGEELS